METTLAYDLDSLAVDVFELVDTATSVESLTAGHGMTELAASSWCFCSCWREANAIIFCSGSCPCSAFGPVETDQLEG